MRANPHNKLLIKKYMTLTNTFVAKLAVAFVAISMMFSFFAPAQAQTAEELQATIDALMAQINALNAQLGTTSGGSMSSSCVSVPAPLTMGAQNADVTALQNFLINAGQSIPAGATGYFGGQTQAALAGWQAANGVAPAVGYYGPITKAAMDAACVVVDDSSDDSTMDDSSDDSSSDDSSSDDSLSGGEADVNSMNGRDEEDAIREGEEDIAVHRVEFDVDDADVMLKRVDVVLDASALVGNTGEPNPWDAFDEMSVWVDGDKVASEDVTDEDDWDDLGSDEYSFRLTGLDTIFREGSSPEVIIALSAANSVDVDGDAGEDDWVIYVDTDGMRFVDGEGIDITAGPGVADASTFEMEDAGAGDDLNLVSSDEDPDSQTYAVDENDNTDHLIFAFDLDADDSDNDVDLDNLISLQVLSGGTNGTKLSFVDDFYVEIDGDRFDAESWSDASDSETVDFDIDRDITIAAGDMVTVMVYATLNDVANTFSDATLIASTSATQIDAEGADDISVDGSDVEGNVHTFRLNGVDVELSSEDTSLDENADTTSADDEGIFTLEFDVTAFGDTLYVPFGAATATDLTAGLEFSILDNNGSAVDLTGATTTVSVDVADGNIEKTNSYKVSEGSTETFTLEVKYDPASTGSYKLRLDTVNFAVTDVATATDAQDVSDLDVDTAKLTI